MAACVPTFRPGNVAAHAASDSRKANAASDPRKADDVHRCMIRADVLRLHGIASRTQGYEAAMSGQSDLPSIEEQIAKATTGATAGISSCGALLELLLAKVMEATSCTLQDIDETVEGAGKNYADSLSLVGPLVAGLERLRFLHEKARTSGRNSAPRSSSKGFLGVAKARTCEVAAQTDGKAVCLEERPKSGYPDVGTTLKTQQPMKKLGNACSNSTKVATTACGVQVCRNEFTVEIGVQANVRPPTSQHLQVPLESQSLTMDAGAQTSARDRRIQSSNASVQTSTYSVHDTLKSVCTQTESGLSNATVRILRMTRAQRLSTQSSPDLLEPKPVAEAVMSGRADVKTYVVPKVDAALCPDSNGAAQTSEASGGRSHEGTPDKGRRHRSQSALRRSKAEKSANVDAPRASVADSSLLRCPVGHGMQWIRSRCNDSLDSIAKEGTLQCGTCSASISSLASFHSCAVCFRDTGERHAVCSACSQGMRGPEKSASGWRSGQSSRGSNMSKSASMSSLPLPEVPAPSPSGMPQRTRTRASEWSMVSSMLPPTPCSNATKSAVTEAVLKQVMPRIELR